MVAVAALAKLAIPIGLGLAFASSKKPAAGPQTMQNMLLVAPNGVVVVDPKMAPWVLQSLSSQYVVPSGNALFEEVALNATGGPGYTNALLWAQAKAAAGKLVLILIDGGKGLAAVAPGQEVELCQRKGGRYAVLLEPPAQAAGLPATPGMPTTPVVTQTPSGPGIVVPGLGTIPLPNFQPGAPGGNTIPGSYQPNSPSSPSSPDQPFPSAPSPGATPGVISIPGLGDFPIPGLPGANVPQPPGPGGTPPPGLGGVLGSTPTSGVFLGPDGLWRHTLRSGDIGTRLAQWYAGSSYRWRELEKTNPDLKLVLQNGQPYGYSPWRIGQILVLPPGWDGSKGPPVQTMSAPRSSPGWR